MAEEELKQRALEEILSETKRAAARAEIGGSLSWAKPKHAGVNKRFLNKTMISTLIQNNIVANTTVSEKQSTSKLLKDSPVLNKAEKEELTEKTETKMRQEKTGRKSNKIIISNKSRLNAYLKSKKEKPPVSESQTEGS